jgi:hypothetical protein
MMMGTEKRRSEIGRGGMLSSIFSFNYKNWGLGDGGPPLPPTFYPKALLLERGRSHPLKKKRINKTIKS